MAKLQFRLLFPIHLDEENNISTYTLAIIPDDFGVTNNIWWHSHLNRTFKTIKAAQTLGNKIKKALVKGEECPCGEKCAFNQEPVSGNMRTFHFPEDPRSAR